MLARLMREVSALGLPPHPGGEPAVTEADLAGKPEPAQRYLRYMGVLGRPRDRSFRIGLRGRFRRSRDERWMACEAWQYNDRLAVARVFHLRIWLGGLVPVLGRDTYVAGRGRMRIRLLDLLTVGDGTGEEFDIGELVTYLDDAVMMAPGMLLVPDVRWSPVDDRSFDVTLANRGHTVTGRVLVDERGAPADFSTTDRFAADPGDPRQLTRARWTTPVEGWRLEGDRRLWTRIQAVWHLPDGEFAYIDVSPIPDTLAYDVPAG